MNRPGSGLKYRRIAENKKSPSNILSPSNNNERNINTTPSPNHFGKKDLKVMQGMKVQKHYAQGSNKANTPMVNMNANVQVGSTTSVNQNAINPITPTANNLVLINPQTATNINKQNKKKEEVKVSEFMDLLSNPQDDLKTLISKNGKLRTLLVKASEKISELNKAQDEMTKKQKEEKRSLLKDMDKIMENYKIYSESHRQITVLKSDYNKLKNDYSHNNQIIYRDQEFIKLIVNNIIDMYKNISFYFQDPSLIATFQANFQDTISNNFYKVFNELKSHINVLSFKESYNKLEEIILEMNGKTSKITIKPKKISCLPPNEENVFKTKSLISASKSSNKNMKRVESKPNVYNYSTSNTSVRTDEKQMFNDYFTEKNGSSPKKKKHQRNISCGDVDLERHNANYFEKLEMRINKRQEKERHENSCSDRSFNHIMLSKDTSMNNSNLDFSFEKPKIEKTSGGSEMLSNLKDDNFENLIYNKKLSGVIQNNYNPKNEKELLCKKSDYIEILSIDSDQNTICGIIDGKIGLVPFNLVQIKDD